MSHSLTIAFDAKRALYNRTGLGNYSRNIIRSLALFAPDHKYLAYAPSKKTPLSFTFPANVQVKYPRTLLAAQLPSLWRSAGIVRDLEKDHVQLFHGLSNEIPFGLHRKKIASVVSIHDLIFFRFPEMYRYADRCIYKNKIRYALKYADAIVAVSEQTKQDIVDFFSVPESTIHVIYQSCDTAFTREFSVQEKEIVRKRYSLPNNYLLYVGTIERRKNVLNLVKAVHRLNDSPSLVVIGKPTRYLTEVIDYIKTNKIGNIVLLHDVPSEDLPLIYGGAMVFVYPSLYEGFGIPVLEALSAGIPVITGNSKCFKEITGDAAISVDSRNPEDIAQAIRSLLDNEMLRNNLKDKGKKRAACFSEEKIAGNMMSLYQSLL